MPNPNSIFGSVFGEQVIIDLPPMIVPQFMLDSSAESRGGLDNTAAGATGMPLPRLNPVPISPPKFATKQGYGARKGTEASCPM